VPAGPASIVALVPVKVRRGGTALVDVRGTGLRPDLRAHVTFKGRDAPGVQVTGQKYHDAGLIKVLLKLDAEAVPGSYLLALADAQGNATNARPFEVTR
jgi:hypothetical protein